MATRTISNAGGLFSAVGSWVEGIVPIAGDAVVATATSGNLTVDVPSACASLILTSYVGTMTWNSTLTTTSTVTFAPGMTNAGTAGTLIVNGSATFTSAGKPLTCALKLNSVILTLADNWVVNGLTTLSVTGNCTINGPTKTLTCAGGVHQVSGNCLGDSKIILTGGTWDSATAQGLGLNLDLAGNVTVSGTVCYGVGILRYVSGTITTTGSTLNIVVGCTLSTQGMIWANVTNNNFVVTLTSPLEWNGTFSFPFNSANSMSGHGVMSTANVAAGTLTYVAGGNLILTATLSAAGGGGGGKVYHMGL